MTQPRADRPLLPGATLGVMGGGQLGRMFVHAAQALGYRTAVLDPDPDSPAGLVSHRHIQADYLDPVGLALLADVADAVTTEFENVPAQSLRVLAERRPVAPAGDAVAICQDRADEKAHFSRAGVPCAPHAVIRTEADLAAVPAGLLPGILKTARMGYDGKGQARVNDAAELAAAWQRLGRVACVLEQRLPLLRELSVIVARGADGQLVNFPVQQNLHRDGILAVTEVPAPDVSPQLAQQAVQCAAAIAAELGYVGVLCVEFFVLADDDGGEPRLVANEMAPRPHNSGHYTLNACDISQFELQVRAMTGLPLAPPRLHSCCVMLNLLGDLWLRDGGSTQVTPPWEQVLALPGAHLHLYGKADARPGRKMGHLTLTGPNAEAARDTALRAAALLGLPGF
ncbi:5-(carboxyamino)imidazole ribonucleotide synthase [Ideonella azotifigens]|uniref:N5-carboxyaminoimidazole ribonucleotide synthase n=1 Tax=Ideonella azotifigens TaxID=513160 RepID=A0ABN1K9H2_9BURK|nr:5-(carboxyamino)imidazole ribonucleotide synthase [Ideonella azotifigens]MCD2339043.1 5-(carboxyamino)imidazole ribonucleotide synthase [Ideonella azotifigens]